jgi:hypothetical protein
MAREEALRLNRDAENPSHTYDYKYILPQDGLADGVVALYEDTDAKRPLKNYVSQGGFILTDELTVYADYQTDVDESYWPVHFSNYLAHVMATDLAYPVTKQLGIQDRFERKTYGAPHQGVGGVYQKARVADSYHSPPNNRMTDFPLTASRRRGVQPWRPQS